MAHVGTITGSMTLDPSAYINSLNQAAQHTAKVSTINQRWFLWHRWHGSQCYSCGNTAW